MSAGWILCFLLAPQVPDGTVDREGPRTQPVLMSPFQSARASFFHEALEVPRAEPGWTLEEGSGWLRISSQHVRSDHAEGRVLGPKDDFAGIYHEFLRLDSAWAPADSWEAGFSTAFAGWDEKQDRFALYDDNGITLVSDEDKPLGLGATKRHANLSIFGLRLKRRILESEEDGCDLTLMVSSKIPFGRDRDLTHAGTIDMALTALLSVDCGWGTVHANLGGTYPLGETNLFRPEEEIRLNAFAHGIVGAVVPLDDETAVGLQVEVNGSAFRQVTFLEDPPATVVMGIRERFGSVVVELAGGAGPDRSSSYEWLGYAAIGVLW